MEVISVNGVKREGIGTKFSKQARRENRIPCVLYGTAKPIHFTVTHNDVKKLIYTPDFKLAEINVDGKPYRSIIKDVQFHPVSDNIQHIDFLALEDGRPVKVALPVEFVGNSPGVRVGGKLQQMLRRIKIKTNPENLVDKLTLDVSNLELGHSIRVRDIQAIEGIEIMSAPATPVAVVEVPRALRSADAAAASEEEEDQDEEA